MEATVKYELSEREHALIHELNVEHIVETQRSPKVFLLVPVIIPIEYVSKYSIGLTNDGYLTDILNSGIWVVRHDDHGNPEYNKGIYADGRVSSESAYVYAISYTLMWFIHRDISSRIMSMAIAKDGQIAPIDLTPVFQLIDAHIDEYINCQPRVAELEEVRKVAYAKYREAKDAAEKADEEARRVKAEARAAEQRKVDDFIDGWIKAHGSEALRLGVIKGYPCKKRFMREFVAKTFGEGYILDYNGKVTTKARSCPSMGALQELVRIEGIMADIPIMQSCRICWLPHNLDELEDEYMESSSVEAIEIELHDGVYCYKVIE